MKMIYSSQPQCLLSSFAMVLDVNLPVLIDYIGHDGMGRVSDDPEPWCFRGVHPQELVRAAFLGFGRSVTLFEAEPMNLRAGRLETVCEYDLGEYLSMGNGVLLHQTGVGHACAWNCSDMLIFDPKGKAYAWQDRLQHNFDPKFFFLVEGP